MLCLSNMQSGHLSQLLGHFLCPHFAHFAAGCSCVFCPHGHVSTLPLQWSQSQPSLHTHSFLVSSASALLLFSVHTPCPMPRDNAANNTTRTIMEESLLNINNPPFLQTGIVQTTNSYPDSGYLYLSVLVNGFYHINDSMSIDKTTP